MNRDVMLSTSYRITLFDPIDDVDDDNSDVFVYFDSGERYVATFFTVKNIKKIMDKDQRTGENLNGTYFWSSEMIIVSRIDQDTVARTVKDLIETGYFTNVFRGPLPPESTPDDI